MRGAVALGLAVGFVHSTVPASRAEAPPVRTFALRSPAEALDEPLSLAFDRRLTIVAPQAIRLAVPGSPDVIGVSVKERVAVVTLVDSDFVRRSRPGTNLTLLLDDGTAVALRLEVTERASDMPTDLVQLEQGPEIAAAGRALALKQVAAWSADPASAPEDVRRALSPSQGRLDARVDDALLGRFARQGADLRPLGARTQHRFIYLTGDRALLLDDQCLLRFTLTNRSQPTFRIGAVRLVAPALADGEGEPAWVAADAEVLADGRPRGVAVRLPAAACAAEIALEVCEASPNERCIRGEWAAP